MTTAVSNPFETPGALTDSAKKTVGAIVVGGDYQGLGIVRSLGRQKVPVCVIDDERSIAYFSKYTTHAVKVPSLRDEKKTVDHLLEIGKRLNLRGWVLYPTREETVAAFSRYRSSLPPNFFGCRRLPGIRLNGYGTSATPIGAPPSLDIAHSTHLVSKKTLPQLGSI